MGQSLISGLGAVLAIIAFQACTTATLPRRASTTLTAGTLQHSELDLNGKWQGITRVMCIPGTYAPGRCNALNYITLNIQQQGGEIHGSYTCRIDTTVCRDNGITSRGTIITGTLKEQRLSLRIFFPDDSSSCLYTGLSSYTEAGGTYTCYQGGGLMEIGHWQLNRTQTGG